MFELHLTTPPIAEVLLDRFQLLCGQLGGQPLIIELGRGRHQVQPMSTFHCVGTLSDVHQQADGLVRKFGAQGFATIRRKIEVDLRATVTSADRAVYVEWHGRVDATTARLAELRSVCAGYDAHLSRNALRLTEQRYVNLRTSRVDVLEAKVSALHAALQAQGWLIDKQRWEAVVHDSNLELDQGWLAIEDRA